MSYQWKNVAIGAGGYVTGLVIHPREPGIVYLRTDIGGFYRWEESTGSWSPITDHFRLAERNYYGGESIAIDPNHPDIVYIAAGLNFHPGTVFRSSDRGSSWEPSDLSTPMHGNGDLRWAGERLAVDPFHSENVLFGSRSEGMFRSGDGGKSWQRSAPFGNTTEQIGILGVLFDPTIEGKVFANVYGDGLYQSDNGGDSWQRMEGSPKAILQMRIDSRGTLYTTGRAAPKVARKARGKDWEDITPLKFRLDRSAPTSTQNVLASFNFNGISVDPNDSNHLLLGIDYKMPGKMYRSTDGGATWLEVGKILNKTVPWWQDNYWGGSMAALVIDPHHPGRVWFTDWFGVWRTDCVADEVPTWTVLGRGTEEIVATTLLAPPAAPTSSGYMLMSGAMDICGLVHYDLEQFPDRKLHPVYQDTWDMDYCASQPWHVVRVGENRAMNFLGDYVVSTETETYGGATTSDEGRSWMRFKAMPPIADRPTSVAVSASEPKVFLILSQSSAFRTEDGGRSWQEVASLPLPNGNRGHRLVADRVDGNAFYYLSQGALFRSRDGGVSFSRVSVELPQEHGLLKVVYGRKGEVWIGFRESGLFHSSDGGSSFARIDTLDRVLLFDFGKPPEDNSPPVLFLLGSVAGQEGVFRSFDFGESWEDISPTGPVGLGCNPQVMAASQQRNGLVFIGTNGRGIFYGLPKERH